MKPILLLLAACPCPAPTPPPPPECSSPTTNVCTDYTTSWGASCPTGSRCLTFTNACPYNVALTYNVGCNSDGKPGSPQCGATAGPILTPGEGVNWLIVDSDTPQQACDWSPACLTSGLAVMANANTYSLTSGTRIEFTSGNSANEYARFDSYDIDIEKGYSVPVSFAPVLHGNCAHDSTGHDCRPLWCDAADCPDAYSSPTGGGCPDRSPQAGCQDTFSDEGGSGFTVTLCPASGASCQDAIPCPSLPLAPVL